MGELARVTDLQRLKQGRTALICINISDLDGAGHVMGPGQKEEVLGLLSERLKGELRNVNDEQCSYFSEVSIDARFDFRQFAVLLPSIDSGSDAESFAERLVKALPVYLIAIGLPGDPVAPLNLTGANMKANSYTLSAASSERSRFSKLYIPRRPISSW